tara:strand:+ start:184 stop:1254 length:1071 start_codon:yes stop_codon:yes gene_type:complete
MELSCVQKSYIQRSFNFDDIHDSPLMNTLIKLQILGYVQLNFIDGDVRFYDNNDPNEPIPESSSYCRGHLELHILKDNFELYFPSYIPGVVMEKSNIMFSPIKWEWGNHCPGYLSSINHEWYSYNHGKWKNVCFDCLENGMWGEVICGSGVEKIKTKVCYVGCRKCVEAQGYTWGRVKLNGESFNPQCNSYAIGQDGLADQEKTNTVCIGHILYDIWDNHIPDFINNPNPQWCDFFLNTPKRFHKIICEILGFYDGPEKHMKDYMYRGQPREIMETLENYYINNYIENNLERTMIIDDYEINTLDIDYEDEVDTIDPKLKCNEGLIIIEDIMEHDGKMDQGKFLELCNIFRDIHQN